MSASPPRKPWLARYNTLLATWVRRAREPAAAEDAVQDAAAVMLENDGASIDHPEAYLSAVARQRLASLYRRRNLIETVSLQALSEDELPAASAGPDQLARMNQLRQGMQDALAELPPACRQVFLWNRFEGRTQAEIAELLGLSHSMVEKHMKRALAHLRDRLRHFAED